MPGFSQVSKEPVSCSLVDYLGWIGTYLTECGRHQQIKIDLLGN